MCSHLNRNLQNVMTKEIGIIITRIICAINFSGNRVNSANENANPINSNKQPIPTASDIPDLNLKHLQNVC